MAEYLKVVMVEPHKAPYVTEIEDELSALQRAVGGYIEVVGNGDGTLVVCNEEGKLEGLEGNRRIHDGMSIIAGTFFVVGEDGENFRSLTESEVTDIWTGLKIPMISVRMRWNPIWVSPFIQCNLK